MKAFTIYNRKNQPVKIVMAETLTEADLTQVNEDDYSDLAVMVSTPEQIESRLGYLRGELRAECISYGELIELESLVPYIDPSDQELLEAAGVEWYPVMGSFDENGDTI